MELNKKEYSSAIKKTPFKYPISKKIASLMLKGLDRNEVYNECYNNNYIEIEGILEENNLEKKVIMSSRCSPPLNKSKIIKPSNLSLK